jgi:MscS family membrane protein
MLANATENATNAFVNASESFSGLIGADLGPLTDMTFLGNTLWQYILFAIAVVGAFLIGRSVSFVLRKKLAAKAAQTETSLDDDIIKLARGPAVLIIVIIGATIGLQFLNMPADVHDISQAVLSIITSLALLWFFMKLMDLLVDMFLAPKMAAQKSELDKQVIPALKKVLKILVIAFGLLSIASNLGYDITALIALFGVVGIGVGFAMKDTFENLLSGIILYTDRPFKVGDRVKIDNDTYGDIEDIGLRSSKIKNLDNNIIIIPNTKLVNAKVENYVRPTRKLKQHFTIGLVYGTTPKQMEKAIKIIKKAITSTEGVTDDEPIIRFMEFDDYSLNILCLYWVKSLKYWDAQHYVNMKILREFEKAGLEMAFPTQTIELKK